MESVKKLPRTKQCAKCPWKISTDPRDIPDGYCEVKHRNLKGTIAPQEFNPSDLFKPLRAMACHYSVGDDGMYCVGWLSNQLGVGNNIPLRIQMNAYDNVGDIETYGEQHERFEDTFPK